MSMQGSRLELGGRISDQHAAWTCEGALLQQQLCSSLLRTMYSWPHPWADSDGAQEPFQAPPLHSRRAEIFWQQLTLPSQAKHMQGKCRAHLVLVWHLPSLLGSLRSSRHSGNRRGSHLESQGLRNSLLSPARSLHKLQETGKNKQQQGVTLWKTSGFTKMFAHGCCVQVGGWYS